MLLTPPGQRLLHFLIQVMQDLPFATLGYHISFHRVRLHICDSGLVGRATWVHGRTNPLMAHTERKIMTHWRSMLPVLGGYSASFLEYVILPM